MARLDEQATFAILNNLGGAITYVPLKAAERMQRQSQYRELTITFKYTHDEAITELAVRSERNKRTIKSQVEAAHNVIKKAKLTKHGGLFDVNTN